MEFFICLCYSLLIYSSGNCYYFFLLNANKKEQIFQFASHFFRLKLKECELMPLKHTKVHFAYANVYILVEWYSTYVTMSVQGSFF